MIFINKRMFIVLFITGIIIFSLFSTWVTLGDNDPFVDSRKELSMKHSSVNVVSEDKGFYLKQKVTGLDPGRYEITVIPVGDNISFIIRTAVDTYSTNITKKHTFELGVRSTVWYAFKVDDPPKIDFESKPETFKVNFKKIDVEYRTTTGLLWAVSLTGGVTFAANEARIYRKKRQ